MSGIRPDELPKVTEVEIEPKDDFLLIKYDDSGLQPGYVTYRIGNIEDLLRYLDGNTLAANIDFEGCH